MQISSVKYKKGHVNIIKEVNNSKAGGRRKGTVYILCVKECRARQEGKKMKELIRKKERKKDLKVRTS